MRQCPSSKAVSQSVKKNSILWNAKIHYRVRDTDESSLHQGFQNGLCPSGTPPPPSLLPKFPLHPNTCSPKSPAYDT